MRELQHADSHVRYNGVTSGVFTMRRAEGVRAYFRGNGTNVIRIIPEAMLGFSLNDYFKSMFRKSRNRPPEITEKLLVGSCAASLQTIAVYPFDLTRTRLATDTTAFGRFKTYKGCADCMRKTIAESGVMGFYRGAGVALATTVPFLAVAMTAYDELKLFIPHDQPALLSWWYPFLCVSIGAVASMSAGVVTYPLDTVLRRRQVAGSGGFRSEGYSSVWQVVRSTYKEGGVRAFYRGVLAHATMAVPAACVQLVAYDYIRQALEDAGFV